MNLQRKTVTAVLIFSLLFAIVFIPSIEGAREHYVTDTRSGEIFTITENGSEITINSSSNKSSLFIDCEVTDICCFDTVFTFLCVTEMTRDDYVYTIYTYNATTGALTSFATDSKATKNNAVFTADGTGKVYILSSYDSRVVQCYEKGTKEHNINCSSNITQMMCVDKGCVLLFAVDGVYLLKGDSAEKLSSLVPVSPCIYSGNGIITDNIGNKYTYDENDFDIYQEETKPASNSSGYEGNIEIDYDSKYITVSMGTTVGNLFDFLGLGTGDVTIKKADGRAVTSGKLGTGMIAFAGNTPYCVIVAGDLTGEGNVNSRDIDALMKHLTNENPLSDIFSKAADLDKDSIITTKDLLGLSRLY